MSSFRHVPRFVLVRLSYDFHVLAHVALLRSQIVELENELFALDLIGHLRGLHVLGQ